MESLSYDGFFYAKSLFAHLGAFGFAIEEHGLTGTLHELVRSMHDGINHVAAAGPRPFVYNSDAYAGLLFLAVCIVAVPLLGHSWFGKYVNKVAFRIAFVLAVLTGAWFRLL